MVPRETSVADKLVHRLPAAVQDKFTAIVTGIRAYRNNSRLLRKSFMIAIFYQASLILVCWMGAHLAGITAVPMQAYFVFVPVIWVVALLPISLNALGVNEVSFAYFFSLFGAPQEQGVLVSLILFGTTLTSSAVGGVLWGIVRYGPAAKEAGPVKILDGTGTVGNMDSGYND
jgi:predicted neutral ceramidase superfamily lipid hydrolase